jgi:peptide/nickel transport system substrate-binding protein
MEGRMRFGRRLKAVVFLLAAATALAACGGSGKGGSGGGSGGGVASGYGTLPAQNNNSTQGGTISFAEPPGAGPNYIFPIVPSANSSVYVIDDFQYAMWRPLWWGDVGYTPTINYGLSLAPKPTFSNNDQTVTINLKRSYKWSDGQPVTANDVIFYIDLLKAAVKENPSNSGNYSPGYFPDNVKSATATSQYTVTLTLDKTYNPTWFFIDQLGLIVPLPSHAWAKASASGPMLDYTVPANAKKIYDFLNGASQKPATFASNPLWQVVDGPYHLTAFNAATDANTLTANQNYTGPQKPHITTINELAFTSTAAEFDQLRSGTLTMGGVDFSDLPQVPALKRTGYNVWGYPDFGFYYMTFNFADKTGHFDKIIGQLYIRQALAHLVDQQGYIRGFLHGAGAPDYGPIPAVPVSPYAPANALANPYPYSIAAAKQLLTSHGWSVVPNGTTTCTKPGSGANQCGAGIPAGTPITFNLISTNSPPVNEEESVAFASAAKQVGITIQTSEKTFNYILQNYNNPSAPANESKWAMLNFGGFTDSLYPTTNTVFNTGGTYNLGSYSNPTADQLIHNSVYGGDPSAVKKEASFLTANLPGLFLPNADLITAWKTNLSGPQDSFTTLSQYGFTPEYWYLVKG